MIVKPSPLILEYFHYSKKNLYPLRVIPFYPQTLTVTDLLSMSVDLPVLYTLT